MDGFSRRREKKQEDILKAAFELFSAQGVQKTSIAEIAEKAKVSQVTIYNYFGSKEGLLEASILWYYQRMYEKYCQVVEGGAHFPEIIKALIFDKTNAISTMHQDFLKSFLSEDSGLKKGIEDLFRNKSLPLLMTILEKGRRDGYIDETISDQALLFYIYMFKEAMDSSFFDDNLPSVLRDLVKLFFFGIMGKPLIG